MKRQPLGLGICGSTVPHSAAPEPFGFSQPASVVPCQTSSAAGSTSRSGAPVCGCVWTSGCCRPLETPTPSVPWARVDEEAGRSTKHAAQSAASGSIPWRTSSSFTCVSTSLDGITQTLRVGRHIPPRSVSFAGVSNLVPWLPSSPDTHVPENVAGVRWDEQPVPWLPASCLCLTCPWG